MGFWNCTTLKNLMGNCNISSVECLSYWKTLKHYIHLYITTSDKWYRSCFSFVMSLKIISLDIFWFFRRHHNKLYCHSSVSPEVYPLHLSVWWSLNVFRDRQPLRKHLIFKLICLFSPTLILRLGLHRHWKCNFLCSLVYSGGKLL